MGLRDLLGNDLLTVGLQWCFRVQISNITRTKTLEENRYFTFCSAAAK
jgi:hypothetical protein